jgi:predicted transcriptional regulator
MIEQDNKVANKKENLEQKALRIIFEKGDEGLIQSELWKELGVTSREASRMAKKFETRGKIERKKVLNNGRWTYILYSKKEPVTLDSIKGCPCLICSELNKCFRGGTYDPVYCQKLTTWIDPSIEPS